MMSPVAPVAVRLTALPPDVIPDVPPTVATTRLFASTNVSAPVRFTARLVTSTPTASSVAAPLPSNRKLAAVSAPVSVIAAWVSSVITPVPAARLPTAMSSDPAAAVSVRLVSPVVPEIARDPAAIVTVSPVFATTLTPALVSASVMTRSVSVADAPLSTTIALAPAVSVLNASVPVTLVSTLSPPVTPMVPVAPPSAPACKLALAAATSTAAPCTERMSRPATNVPVPAPTFTRSSKMMSPVTPDAVTITSLPPLTIPDVPLTVLTRTSSASAYDSTPARLAARLSMSFPASVSVAAPVPSSSRPAAAIVLPGPCVIPAPTTFSVRFPAPRSMSSSTSSAPAVCKVTLPPVVRSPTVFTVPTVSASESR